MQNDCLLISANISRGAGQEVGRSCIMIEFKGKKIMVIILHLNETFLFCV